MLETKSEIPSTQSTPSKSLDRQTIDCLIEKAREKLSPYSHPGNADGMCGFATDEFFDIIEKELPGVPFLEAHFRPALPKYKRMYSDELGGIRDFTYSCPDHDWYKDGCKHPGHVVCLIDGWFIDWTARQFKSDAPFPLVFRIEKETKS